MRSYHRLTLEQRYQIKALKDSELSLRKIGKTLKIHPSTVCRELRRMAKYDPKLAHQLAVKKRTGVGPKKKIGSELKIKVDLLLRQQWSPEQVSGWLARGSLFVSHECIYQYVYRQSEPLFTNLRRKHKRRRSRTTTKNYRNCGIRGNQSWIEERPEVVNNRTRIGDYERDLVLGKNSRILTIVDRASKLTKISRVNTHTSSETHTRTLQLLKGLAVHTITNDNGPEFGLHAITAQELSAKIYFARPYCSWQRGTVENTNGLIRQYFPRGTDFNAVNDHEIKKIENLLNNRPRKKLGYKSPNEVHGLLSQGVALGI